jgi:hypothetical protein
VLFSEAESRDIPTSKAEQRYLWKMRRLQLLQYDSNCLNENKKNYEFERVENLKYLGVILNEDVGQVAQSV